MQLTSRPLTSTHPLWIFALVTVLGITLWLRAPSVSFGMPYFYAEDEAHHFNRVVRMVQHGDWDPGYFHKPSLHFYLRMPVVAASFLWSVRAQQIRSIKEVKTSDRFGLARYSFSASHPFLAKANRAFSLFLSFGILIFVYLIARELSLSPAFSVVAVALTAVSPELLYHSATIGVDIVMSFFVMTAVYASLRVHKNFSLKGLCWAGIFCGLAVSSKYNALPIMVLPLLVVLASHRRELESVALALITPAVGFFLGSPFILSSIPLFLDQFAYEIWHYGVSGHAGHQAEPGLPQFLFYLDWLSKDGVGILTLIASVFGILLLVTKPGWGRTLTFVFPLLFFTLMVFQKANFTRNMIVFVPFVPLLAALVFSELFRALGRGVLASVALFLVIVSCFFQPLSRSLEARAQMVHAPESRNAFVDWFFKQRKEQYFETALDGEIQLTSPHRKALQLSNLDLGATDPLSLYQQGFDQIVVSALQSKRFVSEPALELVERFAGIDQAQRIVRNPTVEVYRFAMAPEGFVHSARDKMPPDVVLGAEDSTCKTPKDPALSEEKHCWINLRRAAVSVEQSETKSGSLTLQLMSPWPNQQVTLSSFSGEQRNLSLGLPGEWQDVSLPTSFLPEFTVELSRIASPLTQGLSNDSRRLGVALRLKK